MTQKETQENPEKQNLQETPKKQAAILMGTVACISFVSACCKMSDPRFTFGGEKFRTPFYSSIFFILLLGLSTSSIALIL